MAAAPPSADTPAVEHATPMMTTSSMAACHVKWLYTMASSTRRASDSSMLFSDPEVRPRDAMSAAVSLSTVS